MPIRRAALVVAASMITEPSNKRHGMLTPIPGLGNPSPIWKHSLLNRQKHLFSGAVFWRWICDKDCRLWDIFTSSQVGQRQCLHFALQVLQQAGAFRGYAFRHAGSRSPLKFLHHHSSKERRPELNYYYLQYLEHDDGHLIARHALGLDASTSNHVWVNLSWFLASRGWASLVLISSLYNRPFQKIVPPRRPD